VLPRSSESVGELEERGFSVSQPPTDQSYLWREAVLLDPDGNHVFIYHAGVNRLDPPWRLPPVSRGRSAASRRSFESG
jgi:hypothetical protein